MKLFGLFFELSGVLYLYRDSVTVLEKIVTTITLMDKIKMKFYPLISSTTLVDRIKRNKSTKAEETNY